MKVLLAKTALDGHWRGVITVATALRDAGMEVVYTGMLTPEEILSAAIQENVDVIGLNVGGHIDTVHRVMDLLHQKSVSTPVVAGGTISPDDITVLKEWGVSEVFPPGSSLSSIVKYFNNVSTSVV